MMLKDSKENVLFKIESNVRSAVINEISWKLQPGNQVTINDLSQCISDAVTAGVREGIQTLLDNRYSDDDFERDITLKP